MFYIITHFNTWTALLFFIKRDPKGRVAVVTGQASGEDVARGLDLLVAGIHWDQQAFGYGSAGQVGALYHGISSFKRLI